MLEKTLKFYAVKSVVKCKNQIKKCSDLQEHSLCPMQPFLGRDLSVNQEEKKLRSKKQWHLLIRAKKQSPR